MIGIMGSLFRNLTANLGNIINLGNDDMSRPMAGCPEELTINLGLDHMSRPIAKGTPMNVLAGCPEELTIMPGLDKLATTKEGKPVMARERGSKGRVYQVVDQYGIPTPRWKKMQSDQARKAAGRWYSGAR